MPQILRTRAALGDYNEIWDYIAIRDVAAADRVLDRLDSALRVIVTAPLMGRPAEELARNLR